MDDYVEKLKDDFFLFVLPSEVNMAGNKIAGLPLPTNLDDAASKEYADRVGVYARAYADMLI